MRVNQTRRKLERGEIAAGHMMLSADPHVVGCMGACGYDFVFFDMEHTSLGFERLEWLVRAADAAGITPLTRVMGPAKQDILKALEAGSQGVMVPMIESAEDAREVARLTRYAPEGERGTYLLHYSSDYGRLPLAEHVRSANREVLTIVQIETARGVENAAEIAAVPGIDCLFIGPMDLSQSLGVLGQMSAPVLQEAIRRVIAVTLAHHKMVGILGATVEFAAPWVEAGVRLLAWNQDMTLLRRALEEDSHLLQQRFGWKRHLRPVGDDTAG
jgi:2-keto-3-deoxy-L-rhamnonate aldolase RhmA